MGTLIVITMIIVFILIFITGVFWVLCVEEMEIQGTWLLIPLMFWLAYFVSEGCYLHTERVKDEVVEHTFVTASPSETKLTGKFFLFYGNLNSGRYYLVREKLSDGYYKDLEVSGDVYLKEDTSLKDQGKYLIKSKCHKITYGFEIGFTWFEKPSEVSCKPYRKELLVPENYILKDLQPF